MTESLQLGVLRLGFFQDGDVGIGVFPECEEVFLGGVGNGYRSIGRRSPMQPRIAAGTQDRREGRPGQDRA